jgi:hypothetical protein
MYDSFHHLLDPRGFVRSLAPAVSRFVLVEPAGDWLGGSQKTLEFDWILSAVDAIRARLVWQVNEDGAERIAAPAAEERGEPVEHRYTIADLKQFFHGPSRAWISTRRMRISRCRCAKHSGASHSTR